MFDGHNGAEASDMASKLLLEYFALHTYFLLDATYSVVLNKASGGQLNQGENVYGFQEVNWDEKLGPRELNFKRCLSTSNNLKFLTLSICQIFSRLKFIIIGRLYD